MTNPRNDAIDAFRGIAIVLVMMFHYTVRWTPPLFATDLYGYDIAFPSLFAIGRSGVHGFFVISGLVITMTVLRSGNALEFAAKRVGRIIPAFAVASLLTLAVCQFGPPPLRANLLDFLAGFTFAPEKFGLDYVDGAYWSLSVELRFYAWVAASFLLLRQRFWLGLLVPAVLSEFIVSGPISWFMIVSYWPLFLFGMAGWYALMERKFIPATALGVVGAALFALQTRDQGQAVFVVCWMGLLSSALLIPNLKIPILPWLGRISYSLYLVHQNIGVMVIEKLKNLGASDAVAIGMTVILVVGISWCLFRGVEQPGQRLVMRAHAALMDIMASLKRRRTQAF